MQTSAPESLKLKQARTKANRERQKLRIDVRHKYLFSVVADRLQLDSNAVEEFMLDGDQVRKLRVAAAHASFYYTKECLSRVR